MLIFQSLFELPLAVYSLAGTVAVMIGAVSFMGSCVWAPQGHLCREALGYPVHASASNLSGISQCIGFRELGYAPLRTTQAAFSSGMARQHVYVYNGPCMWINCLSLLFMCFVLYSSTFDLCLFCMSVSICFSVLPIWFLYWVVRGRGELGIIVCSCQTPPGAPYINSHCTRTQPSVFTHRV